MQSTMNQRIARFYTWLGSSKFWWATAIFFLVHTLWIAASAWRLPYDEYYHLGIIDFYANQWSPFVAYQPEATAIYGDITRLPSYMYHYLMSFPYRLITAFGASEVLTIFLLRAINIGFVLGAIALFRKLFLEAGIKKPIVNLATLAFVASPMVIMLAAQSNYDNGVLLLTPLLLLYAHRILTKKLDAQTLLAFCSIGMFGSLVKYSFLPLFLFVACAVAGMYIYKHSFAGAFRNLRLQGIPRTPRFLVLAVLFLAISGLFIERHAVNALYFGNVNVRCQSVQPREFCEKYSPWRRNQNARAMKESGLNEELFGSVAGFGVHWVATMNSGLFAVFANIPNTTDTAAEDPYGHYIFKPLLPALWLGGSVLVAGGIFCIILQLRRLWREPLFRLILLVSGGLLITLFLFNYNTYRDLGRPYAIQVRYMYPLQLPLFVVCAAAFSRQVTSRRMQVSGILIGLFIVLYSGGAISWIIRAQPEWYMQNATVITINQAAQRILQTIVWH